MDSLLVLSLEPNKVKQLPDLGYSGPLLLRWQILQSVTGVDPLSLVAGLDAQQTIEPVGYLERGQWQLPGGDRLRSPLLEISYSPLFDWFITTPQGFKTSQLFFYEFNQPVYQIPNTGQSMSISVPNPVSRNSTSATVAAAVASQLLIAANDDRLSGLILNKTNRVLWVSFGTIAATAAAPSLAIPAGANIDIPDGYVGAIQGICAGSAGGLTGTVQVVEFTP